MMQREGIIGPPDGSRPRDVLKRPDWLEEGIIGPPDGSRPREVLKRPDWLEEVESQLR